MIFNRIVTRLSQVQLILMNRIIIVMWLVFIIILYTICKYLIIELLLIYKILLNVSNKNLINHDKKSRAASINHNHKNIWFHFKRWKINFYFQFNFKKWFDHGIWNKMAKKAVGNRDFSTNHFTIPLKTISW